MKHKLVAFGASNSSTSINRQWAAFAARQVHNAEVELLDLNDYEVPLYSIDREKKDGIPEAAHRLLQHLTSADGLVISFAEHNGNVTAVWKNLEDWISRIDRNAWRQKPLFLLATSPGGRGGQSALAISSRIYSFRNPYPIAQFSLPGFRKNFTGADIADEKLKRDFETQLQQFEAALKNPVSTA